MDTFRRKVPSGIRPSPGNVPATVFNSEGEEVRSQDSGSSYLDELKAQKIAEEEQRSAEKRKDLEMLNNYNPWGKPGCGAPRNNFQHFNRIDKTLNDSENSEGSFADYLNKPGPGCGAPKRTESGNPVGTMQVHPDIRNETAAGILNETTRKRKSNPVQPGHKAMVDSSGNWSIRDGHDGEQSYRKSHVLNCDKRRVDTSMKSRLREKLDEQVAEKNIAKENEKSAEHTPHNERFGKFGKVGYVVRDSSGRIAREEPLTKRGATYLREFYGSSDDGQGLVDQLGRPGPGVPVRTDSGHVHSWPRNKPVECEDPFRPGNCAYRVFPVGIESEANERALRRSADNVSVTKHSIENGYYQGEENGTIHEDPRFKTKKPIGTVYSAMLRNQGTYLDELRRQIDENSVVREKQKKTSQDEEFHHYQHSLDCFGRPGNGAPRLMGGTLDTSRYKMNDIECVAEGIRNPGAFRVT